MKRIRFARIAAALLAAVLTLTGSAFAQTALTSTTLSAALSGASDQVMSIASASGWTATSSSAQTYAVIDREVVGIRSVSGTQVGITRGLFSTRATGHISGATVYYIPAGAVALSNFDRSGACSTSAPGDQTQNGTTLPVLNPTTGRAYTCLGGAWTLISDMMGARTCTVTQATSKSTGVTCAGVSGVITMNAAALAAAAEVGFTVTDTAVAATDAVALSIKSGATADSYQVAVDAVAAGSFRITMSNVSAGSLSEAVVLNFKVVKD